MSLSVTRVYEVFQRKAPTDPMMHVGSVNAGDTRMALLMAKECFFRRDYPAAIWVADRDDLHPLVESDVLQPGTDKSYRSIEAYKGSARKRERIEAAYQAAHDTDARQDAPSNGTVSDLPPRVEADEVQA